MNRGFGESVKMYHKQCRRRGEESWLKTKLGKSDDVVFIVFDPPNRCL